MSRAGFLDGALRWVLALLMTFAGVMHFVRPGGFVRIVPAWLPAPELLVYVSGAAEIALGLGLLVRRTRRWAAWGLIALLVAVFPANVNMAVNHIGFGSGPTPAWVLWARLPLQAVLILWAYRYTRRARAPAAGPPP